MCFDRGDHALRVLRVVTVSRPDAQLFEGRQEEQQLNGELPDDILRRQIINSLAKHVIFSKERCS